MKKPIFVVLIFCFSFQSCSKHLLTTSERKPADSYFKKQVSATYFWGIINKPHTVVDTTCGDGGLIDVKITTHLGYTMVNIVTLGIVNLVKMEWKCQKEPPRIGHQP